MLYACAETVKSKLGVKPKKKRKPDKNFLKTVKY